MIFNFYKSYLK